MPPAPEGASAGGSTPVSAKPAATAPDTATSAAKSAADRGPHAAVPTPRPTPPADQSMPAALAAVDRDCSAASPAKPAVASQADGLSRPQSEAAGPSAGSAQPPHRARRSRYIPAPVRREVWRRDGGRCSYVDPHSGRRCGSRFLLELDHIVPLCIALPTTASGIGSTDRRQTGPRDRRVPEARVGRLGGGPRPTRVTICSRLVALPGIVLLAAGRGTGCRAAARWTILGPQPFSRRLERSNKWHVE